jgi:hypothetical protein
MRRSSGADALEGGEHAVQDVVPAAKVAAALDRHHIGRLRDHADRLALAPRVGADPARVGGGQGHARRAQADLIGGVDQGLGQLAGLGLGGADQVHRQAGRRLLADAGQAGQLADQALDRIGGHRRARIATGREVGERSDRAARGLGWSR